MKSELGRAIVFGMVAGVVATVIMDLFVAVAMVLMGNPVAFMFMFIGDVGAAFFSRVHLLISGGAVWGALFHYLFGMAYGALFCGALCLWPRLKPAALGLCILLGILYIEIFSQPFIASAPLLIPMSASDVSQWYMLSTVMHALYGAILGLLGYYRDALLARMPVPARA